MTILGADDEGRLRALLDSLGYDLEPSILIGGWATNARVGGEISHDIDLIITDQNLRQRLPAAPKPARPQFRLPPSRPLTARSRVPPRGRRQTPRQLQRRCRGALVTR